jgi:endonuclease III related protein
MFPRKTHVLSVTTMMIGPLRNLRAPSSVANIENLFLMKANQQTAALLKKIYRCLWDAFGPQHWWPGDTPFEIIVGAILTQNTNWTNVEKAIAHLKKAKLLSAQALWDVPEKKLATLIKPAGYYNIKARRLKNFLRFLFERYHGDLKAMGRIPVDVLRKELLEINGIGPETADSILLYVFGKPVFVVDAYTKRLLSRHGVAFEKSVYSDIQKMFMENLENNAGLFNEYHALIVRLGKEFCRTRPLCSQCPFNNLFFSVKR